MMNNEKCVYWASSCSVYKRQGINMACDTCPNFKEVENENNTK